MKDSPYSITRRSALKKGSLLAGTLVIGTTAATGTAAAGIGEGRVGHYPLNNLKGKGKTKDKVHDASPEGNDGTWEGDGDPVVKGRVGNAFEFDGDGDYVEISGDVSASFETEVSMAAWVKPEVDDAWKAILALDDSSKGGNSPPALLRATTDGEWEYFLDTANGTTTGSRVMGGTVNEGSWTHVAGTYDGSTVTVYEDGETVAEEEFGGALDDVTDGMFIGVWQKANGDLIQYWEGEIDDARVYNRSLSSEEVQDLAAMGE